MPVELAQIAAGAWPVFAALALAAVASELRLGRRRAALNEAVHELRRPLQAIALAAPSMDEAPAAVRDSLSLASAALARLDREINGGGVAGSRERFAVAALLMAAAARWRARAEVGGGSLELDQVAADAALVGDRVQLAQAVDNLVVNAIEHGGGRIRLGAELAGEELRIVVADRGRRRGRRRVGRGGALSRLRGSRRRGHGLRIVRRAASAHGGGFELRRSERGAEAVLSLPVEAQAGDR